MQLRPYQLKAHDDIKESWSKGNKNVIAVLPTGAGKTVLFSKLIQEHKGASAAIAHRQELVCQIALALSRCGVHHRIIAPPNVIRNIVKVEMSEIGRSFYDSTAQCGVVGVDTLVRRGGELKSWLNTVTLVVQDECHHTLKSNKWGKAAGMFPHSKMLGVTATPERADGKGLGAHHDGLFDDMIEGPSMRDLIEMGYLSDYRIFAPPSDLDLSHIEISKSTGDYSKIKLSTAVQKSHILGDVVTHYKKIAMGKLGITFCTNVEQATETSRQFNEAGVPSAVVSAKTPDLERSEVMLKFKRRELLQIVNVDLFGEGFDLPAIEVVCMARPTKSYGLYIQIFGRALRILEGKDKAIIIDHVGNVMEHGLPDAQRKWSLDRRPRKAKAVTDATPCKTCTACTAVYERIYKQCPYCEHIDVPEKRSNIKFVDGDLYELDQETLNNMRTPVDDMDKSQDAVRAECDGKNMEELWIRSKLKHHRINQESQAELRGAMAYWAGVQRANGRSDSEIYRLFYLKFGIDVLSAKALKSKESKVLKEKLNLEKPKEQVVKKQDLLLDEEIIKKITKRIKSNTTRKEKEALRQKNLIPEQRARKYKK